MEPLITRQVAWLAVGFAFLFCGASHQQFLVNYLRGTLGWHESTAQALLATVYVSFAAWRLLVCHTLVRLGGARSILFGAATYPAFVLTILVASYAEGAAWATWLCFAAATAWGWGAASMWITSGTHVLSAAPKTRYGTATGFFYGGTNAGFAVGVVAFDALMRSSSSPVAGERWRLVATAGVMVVGIAVLTRVRPDDSRLPTRPGNPFRALAHPEMRVAAFLMFSGAVGFGLMLSVYPNYLRETVTLSVLSAAAFSPLARAVLSVTGSPFSDRWGRGRVLFVSFGVSALGVGVAVAYPSGWSASLAALMLGLQGGLVPPIATALVGDVTAPEDRPSALGAVFFWRDVGVVMVFGVSILRSSTGFTVEARALMGAFAALYAVCAVVSAFLVRGRGR